VLLVALPLSFLAGCALLLARWLLLPKLSQRRAVFVLWGDPGAAATGAGAKAALPRPPQQGKQPAALRGKAPPGVSSGGGAAAAMHGAGLLGQREGAAGLQRTSSAIKAVRPEDSAETMSTSEASPASTARAADGLRDFAAAADLEECAQAVGPAAAVTAAAAAGPKPALDVAAALAAAAAAAGAADSPAANGCHQDMDSARMPSDLSGDEPLPKQQQPGTEQEAGPEEQQGPVPRGWSFSRAAAVVRGLCGARPYTGTWISLHLDSRCVQDEGWRELEPSREAGDHFAPGKGFPGAARGLASSRISVPCRAARPPPDSPVLPAPPHHPHPHPPTHPAPAEGNVS
jgi:hypothetical protein